MIGIRVALLIGAMLAFGAGDGRAVERSPYAGLETRPVKALSEAQIRGYLAGDGMGLALAAELNHHPGPRHLIALAERLGLGADQIAHIRRLEADMTGEAVALGRAIVEREHALDKLFATASADEEAVREAVSDIAGKQGALRHTHLKYHLIVKSIVTPDQIELYDRLRGYAGADRQGHGHDAGKAHGGHHRH